MEDLLAAKHCFCIVEQFSFRVRKLLLYWDLEYVPYTKLKKKKKYRLIRFTGLNYRFYNRPLRTTTIQKRIVKIIVSYQRTSSFWINQYFFRHKSKT